MNILAWILGLGTIIIILLLVSYVFWLVMFIDAVKRRDVLWIVLFIFSFFTGFLPGILATVYFFVAYKH